MLAALATRRALLAISAAACLAAAPSAQGTTGVAGINDYTVNGSTAGSSSCAFVTVPAGLTKFNVDTSPGLRVVFLFNVNCPCRPCLLPWPPTACPLPLTTLCPFTNQAFELDPSGASCLFLSGAATSNAAGQATLAFPVPPLIRFSTQAIMINPCDPGNLLFTQAYQISTV